MRNIKHHVLIITVHEKKLADSLRQEISELYQKNMEAKNGFRLISPTVESLINNYYTFFIAPDGSKEGYDLSEDGDRIRKMTIALLDRTKITKGQDSVNYIEVSYGADQQPAEIQAQG